MRILACFKVTPDFEMLRESEWVAGAANGVDTRYVRRILNCFDESALEMALRLSEALAGAGGGVSLGAMSVGGAEAEPFLKTLLALGYESGGPRAHGRRSGLRPRRHRVPRRALRGAGGSQRPAAARLPKRPRGQRLGALPGRRGAGVAVPDAGDRGRAAARWPVAGGLRGRRRAPAPDAPAAVRDGRGQCGRVAPARADADGSARAKGQAGRGHRRRRIWASTSPRSCAGHRTSWRASRGSTVPARAPSSAAGRRARRHGSCTTSHLKAMLEKP